MVSRTQRPRRLPFAEKRQLPLVQAHAFDHYLHGRCNGHFPIDDARGDFRCPLCWKWSAARDFTIDHAPQSAGQSRLGAAWTTVLSCECNHDAGAGFESDASQIDRSAVMASCECKVHGDVSIAGGFDSQFMTKVEATSLADVKSAYLIAFVVLGYSWCSASRVRCIREALLNGSKLSTKDVLITCGLASDRFPERSVIEVLLPEPMVLVVGPQKAITVALPGGRTERVDAACVAASAASVANVRIFEWPLTVRKTAVALGLEEAFVKPEDAWDRGMTFHLDRCSDGHQGIVNPARALSVRLNRAVCRPPARWDHLRAFSPARWDHLLAR